jgi:polyisoprenoid-binding protein YceI
MPLYQVDSAHSSAAFKVRHMMIAYVKGDFTKISGTVNFDDANPTTATIDVTIDASSIHTREPQRDDHLRSPDFLDVAKFPSITFHSEGESVAAGKDTYEVVGDLSIHGVTQRVALLVDSLTPEAKDPWGGFRRGASATVTIVRKDFGLTWNTALETGGLLVGEDVHITLEVELVRKG